MVIKAALRAYAFIDLFGFSVDAILVNPLISALVKDPYLKKRMESHPGKLQTDNLHLWTFQDRIPRVRRGFLSRLDHRAIISRLFAAIDRANKPKI